MIFVVGAVLLPRQQAKLGPGVAAGGCTRRRLRTWSRESRIQLRSETHWPLTAGPLHLRQSSFIAQARLGAAAFR